MTIQCIVQQALHTGVFNDHLDQQLRSQITKELKTEAEIQALDRLIEALIDGSVQDHTLFPLARLQDPSR